MVVMLLLILIGAAALLLACPEPRPWVIYMPLAVEEAQSGGLGCLLPLLLVILLLLLFAGSG